MEELNMRDGSKSTVEELSKTTWTLAREAISAGNTSEALRLLEKAEDESEKNNNNLTSFIEQVLTHLATINEEEVAKVIRERYNQPVREWMATTQSVEDSLRKCLESQRRHQARFTIREEADKYVVTYDPCGTGGRLRRARDVGKTKKPHPWSWGKKGIPYYCTHCCVHWEILPIEQQGYPIRITMLGDRPEDPCIHLFYKKPEFIPEEYFERVGKKKK
jgi:hypothetical protein